MLKTHTCGELNRKHVGASVSLAGWVDRRRDHGGLIFIDLRDREGLVQVVFNPETAKSCHEIASEMRNEYVVSINGEVALRPPGTENPKLPTGEIEVIAQNTAILNTSKTPPFYINEDIEVDENLRLKLWQHYLPESCPRAKDVDLSGIAEEYALSPAQIKQAIIAAATEASFRIENREITQSDLIEAIKKQQNELGNKARPIGFYKNKER